MSLDTTASPLFPVNSSATTKTHTIYLALGSNLGNQRGHLSAALQQLLKIMDISAVSSLYETAPVGYLDQPNFLNMVCSGKTKLSEQELLRAVKSIETTLGRQTTFRNGPRPIDIDIIFYDDLQIKSDNLTIPHPLMAERAFVLAPLAEIASDRLDPVSTQRVAELLAAVPQDGVQKLAETIHPYAVEAED